MVMMSGRSSAVCKHEEIPFRVLLELSQNPPMSGSGCCPTSFAASCGIQGGGGVGTRPWWLALLACGGAYWPLAFEQGGGGMISWGNSVSQEGGHIFPWRNLGALAVQCVPEAVQAVGFARAAKFPPPNISPAKQSPRRSPPPPVSRQYAGPAAPPASVEESHAVIPMTVEFGGCCPSHVTWQL